MAERSGLDLPIGTGPSQKAARRMLLPFALTQFVASFAGSNMNVAIGSISKDLHTTIHGVQTAITVFLLCMAALMIPGSKLTDLWGRKRCLMTGPDRVRHGGRNRRPGSRAGSLDRSSRYSGLEGVGSALMIPPIKSSPQIWAFVPGLAVVGLGLGVMLTPSVNVVQSSFPEEKQGEISGLSRSVSNLGSSLGTVIAGTILVSALASANKSYVLAMAALAAFAVIGFGAAMLFPATPHQHTREGTDRQRRKVFDSAAERA